MDGKLENVSGVKGMYRIGLYLVLLVAFAFHASLAAPPETELTIQSLVSNDTNKVSVTREPDTGFASFIQSDPNHPILDYSLFISSEERARAFLNNNRNAFIDSATNLDLVTSSVQDTDEVGMSHVSFQQQINGIPVRGGEVVVHMNDAGITAVNSSVVPNLITINTTPSIASDAALEVAKSTVLDKYGPVDSSYTTPRLEIFDSSLYSRGPSNPKLAWFVEAQGTGLLEYIWVDAQTGELLFNYSQVEEAINRQVYDARNIRNSTPVLTRTETSGISTIADVNSAFDNVGNFYNYYLNQHNRRSFDNNDGTIISIVRYCDPDTRYPCPFLNAFWDGKQIWIGQGLTIDDVVAHELTHGVIQYTVNLAYLNESGALNESYADIFGETVDLTDNNGDEIPANRWIMGEEIQVPGRGAGIPSFGFRSMMNPNIYNDPAKVIDANFYCGTSDNGGVHTNSGVPNHAYALMVDGSQYNGYTISGIGLTKAAAIEYRVLNSKYITSNSNFVNNVNALAQSCADLIGTKGITYDDCAQVKKALLAVEMSTTPCSNAKPPAKPISAPAPTPPVVTMCPSGQKAQYLFQDDLENTASGNWSNSIITGVNHWSGGTGTPNIYFTGNAKSGLYSFKGTGVGSVGDSAVAMTKDVKVPNNAFMWFDSDVNLEGGFDGGVIEYSVDGGANWIDAGSLITGGRNYNGSITPGFSNPLEGRQAFTGSTGGYVSSQLNLSSLNGQNIRFRFRIGTDKVVSSPGWFIDNIAIYTCAANSAPVAQNGTLTTKEDTAANGNLVATDADSTTLSYILVTDGSKGKVTINASSGAYTYTPNLNANGSDTFTFKANDGTSDSNEATVTVAITPVNDAPVANNSTITTNEDTAISGVLSASDVDADKLTFSLMSNGAKGKVTVNANTGAYTYTPDLNVNGNDSFTFKVNDGVLDSSVATVAVTITAVNDAPVANNSSLNTKVNTAIDGSLSATDIDGDTLTYSLVNNAGKGQVSLNPNTGAYTYTPNLNVSGDDTFTFKANDGKLDSNVATVTVTIAVAGNVAPNANDGTFKTNEDVALNGMLSATDANSDALTYILVNNGSKGAVNITNAATGAFTYTPNPNANGSDSFTFKANDGLLDSNTATVTISIAPVNDAPVASAGNLSTKQNVTVKGMLTASDVDGDGLTYSLVTDSANGQVTIDNAMTGAYSYTPKPDFTGTDSFTFKVNDGTVDSMPATISISVNSSGTTVSGPAIIVSPVTNLYTTEDGGQAEFTVVLNTQPTANVTINLASENVNEGVIDQSSLVFTPENWSNPQKVTISGVDDDNTDGDVDYTIKTDVSVSDDPNYNKINPDDVTVTNKDNEHPDIIVSPVSGLTTSESGQSAKFSVVLGSKPSSSVFIHLHSSNEAEGVVVPADIVFSADNWNKPQDITIKGISDNKQDGNAKYTIITDNAVSQDSFYNDFEVSDVQVTNLDNNKGGSGALSGILLWCLMIFVFIRQRQNWRSIFTRIVCVR